MGPGDAVVIDGDGLDRLIAHLHKRGYRVLGPVVRDGAVMQGDLRDVTDLPKGWHDRQSPGEYRLEQTGDDSLFGWAVGPQSTRSETFPARAVLWRSGPGGEDAEVAGTAGAAPTAFVGLRPCDLAATAVLDRVLAGGSCPDPAYLRARQGTFVVAAECGAPSGNCFCSSMGTGPAATTGYDLALTELPAPGHRFVVRVGTEEGAEVLGNVPHRQATETDLADRLAVIEGAEERMGRRLDTDGLPALLARNIDHPRWDEVAERCLACGNCTLVCPTCFCSTVRDTSALDGSLQRTRTWASCFDLGHSYLHGGPVRVTTKSRYRQWMTHKLSTWHDQFGESGCVGCGRCITWCPVGIDITEEAAAIRSTGSPPAGEEVQPG